MSVANFIPTIWSARLLAHLDKAHVYAGKRSVVSFMAYAERCMAESMSLGFT